MYVLSRGIYYFKISFVLLYSQSSLFVQDDLLCHLHKILINQLVDELLVALSAVNFVMVYFFIGPHGILNLPWQTRVNVPNRKLVEVVINPGVDPLHEFLVLALGLQIALLLALSSLENKVFPIVVFDLLVRGILHVYVWLTLSPQTTPI